MTGAHAPEPADEITRRFAATAAGIGHDEKTVRRLLADHSAQVRAAAIAALVEMGGATADDVRRALSDPDARVRRATCELAGRLAHADFTPLLADDDPAVVEAAAFAVGETGDRRGCPRLSEIARSHPDPLCREAAVAALGAIGDDAGRQPVWQLQAACRPEHRAPPGLGRNVDRHAGHPGESAVEPVEQAAPAGEQEPRADEVVHELRGGLRDATHGSVEH
jgi:hypothetical protein